MRSVLIIWFQIATIPVFAQYWFGPKVGFHRVDHDYQLTGYKTDTVIVKPNYNFQLGGVMTYTASDRYSVHIEINYERIGKHVENLVFKNEDLNSTIDSKMNFHFLTLPFMLRVNFGQAPVRFYVNGGPKFSIWLGGNGKTNLEEFEETRLDENDNVVPEVWKIRFKKSKSTKNSPSFNPFEENILILENANILQYSLVFGGGAYFDLTKHSSIMLDLRYSFGHSNMGFNGSRDFEWSNYFENFEYRHHMLSLSVGYMFDFNVIAARKGKSTSRLSK